MVDLLGCLLCFQHRRILLWYVPLVVPSLLPLQGKKFYLDLIVWRLNPTYRSPPQHWTLSFPVASHFLPSFPFRRGLTGSDGKWREIDGKRGSVLGGPTYFYRPEAQKFFHLDKDLSEMIISQLCWRCRRIRPLGGINKLFSWWLFALIFPFFKNSILCKNVFTISKNSCCF